MIEQPSWPNIHIIYIFFGQKEYFSFQVLAEYSPLMKAINEKMNEVTLYKWKKAKWLQSLDPVIPEHMKIVEESLDDDDE